MSGTSTAILEFNLIVTVSYCSASVDIACILAQGSNLARYDAKSCLAILARGTFVRVDKVYGLEVLDLPEYSE
jgi:hypothetical protein